MDYYIKPGIMAVMVIMSAFFSGSEVTLFSLDKKKIKTAFADSLLAQRYLLNLIEHPRRILVTLLVGNTLVNIGISIVGVLVAQEFARHYGISEELAIGLQVVLVTLLILLFGEISPKVFARKNPLLFARVIYFPLYWVYVFLFPIAEFFTELIKGITDRFRFDKKRGAISGSDLEHLADIGHEKGALDENEHELIRGLVKFRDVAVREIMIPRVDMISASQHSSVSELINLITSSGHRRIPIYRDKIDQIVGIIYAKDLLPFIGGNSSGLNFPIVKLARKPLFVPANKKCGELMQLFQEKKMHIAIVVDEYGGTAGLATMEDIIEEIIGELRDETEKEASPFQTISEGKFIADGSLTIGELKENLGIELNVDEDEFDTIGGMVFEQAGAIPEAGYSFEMEGYKFTVTEMTKRRVRKVSIEKVST